MTPAQIIAIRCQLFYKCTHIDGILQGVLTLMESGEHQPDPRIGRFWTKYAEFLRQFRVPAKAVPWYRRHIEAFIADHPDVRLLSHSAESVERWLSKVGRDPNLTDWQFRQKVDALRILMGHSLRLPWCSAFDWDRWSSGAQSLESDHPTVSRTYGMIDAAVADPKKISWPGSIPISIENVLWLSGSLTMQPTPRRVISAGSIGSFVITMTGIPVTVPKRRLPLF